MAEELLGITNDSLRREIVRGGVRTMARAGDFHGRIVMNVSTPLDQHVRANRARRSLRGRNRLQNLHLRWLSAAPLRVRSLVKPPIQCVKVDFKDKNAVE
jgi:hypothetical protein